MKAFTLIETLIVVALIGFIFLLSSYLYIKFYQSGFSLEESANIIVKVLNLAKEKSIIAEENSNWGVWFINTSSPPDYFYLFKENTSTLINKYYLPKDVSFSDFIEKTIIFNKFSGETTSTTLKISSYNKNKIIYISNLGTIRIE